MQKPRFYYGYWMVMAGFLIQVLGFGLYSAFGVFFIPLLDEFGWSRAVISGAAALLMVLWGVSNLLAGFLTDRIGPRFTTLIFGVLWALGYMLMSRISTVWQLYLFYGVLVGMGIGFIDVLPLSVVARWFVRRRGMMTGLVKAGAGVGIFLFPLISAWLLLNYGWRPSFFIVGGVALIFAAVVAQFLKRDPSQVGLRPYGDDAAPGGSNVQMSGLSLREAFRTKQFWMLCAVYLIAIFCGDGIIVHVVPLAIDLGIPPETAAGVLAVFGAVSVAGRFTLGSLADRLGARRPVVIALAILVLSFVWVNFVRELWPLYLFAAVYGFAQGGLYTLISPWVAELFGLNAHGAIFGAIGLGALIIGASGPLLFGYFFDITGSYGLALIIAAALGVVAILLTLLMRPVLQSERSLSKGE